MLLTFQLHYYQPLFTLIGAGLKELSSSHRNMKDILPKKAKWVKDSVSSFQPKDNSVTTKEGHTISYDYMIVATGLQLNYDAVSFILNKWQNRTLKEK